MRPQKVNDTELLNKIVGLIRSRGFAGTSLSTIAELTGLKKASLYHRFPGGKEEIVLTVLKHTSSWVKTNILDELKNSDKKPSDRLNNALIKISAHYNNGLNQCLFRSLSMEIGDDLFKDELHNGMLQWLGAFTKLGVDFGNSYDTSEKKAMEVITLLQGSLVICNTLNTTTPFKETVNRIRLMYMS